MGSGSQTDPLLIRGEAEQSRFQVRLEKLPGPIKSRVGVVGQPYDDGARCADEGGVGSGLQPVNSRFDVNSSNRWLTATTVQYNHVDEEGGLNLHLNYIYRTGDDIFFIFSRSVTGVDRSGSLSHKFTHTFDF